MSDIIVIGGGGAGLTAALAAKKAGKDNVSLITKEQLSYSPCALPFVIGGHIGGCEKISSSLPDICKANGINCIPQEAVAVDYKNRTVKTNNGELHYDKLILATGGYPAIPPIKGKELGNVYALHRMEDAKKIINAVQSTKHAVVVGGGVIGLEAAVAFVEKGLKVTVIEGLEYVLFRLFDPDYCQLVEKMLQEHGIDIIKGKNVEELTGSGKVEGVRVAGNLVPAEVVIIATGMRSAIKLTENSGMAIECGGIRTDEHCETSIKDVYAAGDCTVAKSILTGKLMPSLLGTTAIRQGTCAGLNAAGEHAVFDGVMNSMAIKLFDTEIGRCGLTERDAKAEGIETVTGRIKSSTTAEYYPGGKSLEVKLIFNASNKELIGAQIIGGGEVTGKVDLLTYAVTKHATVEELANMEYCYTPPLAPSHNAVVLAAENAHRKIKRKEEMEKRKK